MKLQNNLSIKNSMFIKHHASEFNEQQLEVLRKAIEHDVDVTQYADPKYDARQLNIIFLGLLNNTDVSYYADPAFSNFQMETIMGFLREYQGTPRGENVVLLAQPQLIRAGRERNLDVSRYESRKLTQEEAKKIYYELLDEKILNHKRKQMTKVQLEK